jgi:hypothetical protein
MQTSTDVIIATPRFGAIHARPTGSANRQVNTSPGVTSVHLKSANVLSET